MPLFWSKMPRRYKELYGVTMAPLPGNEITPKHTSTAIMVSQEAATYLQTQGELNVAVLHKDGLIPLGGDQQVLKQFGKYKDFADK